MCKAKREVRIATEIASLVEIDGGEEPVEVGQLAGRTAYDGAGPGYVGSKDAPDHLAAGLEDTKRLAAKLDRRYWQIVEAEAERELVRLTKSPAFLEWVRGAVKDAVRELVRDAVERRELEILGRVDRVVGEHVKDVTRKITEHLVGEVQGRIVSAYRTVDLAAILRERQ